MHVPLFKHLFDWEHGLVSVWHDLPMKFALHSHTYVWFVDNLQMPWFEQLIKHELISIPDWSIITSCCMSAWVRLFKLSNDRLIVLKGWAYDFVYDPLEVFTLMMKKHVLF